MADEQQSGGGFASNGYVWLFVAAVGAVSAAFLPRVAPLEDFRPTASALDAKNLDEQKPTARLWEDPFAPLTRAPRGSEKTSTPPKVGRVVVVMVPGLPRPEEAETRRRT